MSAPRRYPTAELYDERSSEFYRSGGRRSGREFEELDVDIRSHRDLDFLDDNYGRTPTAGALVVRDRPRQVEREEIIIDRERERAPAPRPAPPPSSRARSVEREEIVIRRGERERFRRDAEREEIDVTIRREEDSRPPPRRRAREVERDDVSVRRSETDLGRPREVDREDIIIRRGGGPRPARSVVDHEDDITIRREEREGRGRRFEEREEIEIRHRSKSRQRHESLPPHMMPLGRETEELIIRRRKERTPSPSPSPPPPPPPRRREYEREEIIIRRTEERDPTPPPPPPPPEPEPTPPPVLSPIYRPPIHQQIHQEIITHHRHIDHGVERAYSPSPSPPPAPRIPTPPPPAPRRMEETLEVDIRRRGPHGEFEDIRIVDDHRGRGGFEEDIKIGHDHHHGPRGGFDEDITIKHDHRGPRGGFDEDITIKHDHRGPRSAFEEDITIKHDHRGSRAGFDEDIKIKHDHRGRGGFEEEIKIEHDHRGPRGGFEEEITIEHTHRGRTNNETALVRHRSLSAAPSRRGYNDDLEEEAGHYNRKQMERAYVGEGYNGSTKDWAIVDVPPGTERVRMDGAGGGSQEVTWQTYNGVRRAKFRTGDREFDTGFGVPDRKPSPAALPPPAPTPAPAPAPPPAALAPIPRARPSDMWTEITKDLVLKDAVDAFGYEYEETEFFFYVMEYLRYEDVLQLVEFSDEIRRERRRRIREIEWEREHLRRPRRSDRDRYYEHDVVIESRRRH